LRTFERVFEPYGRSAAEAILAASPPRAAATVAFSAAAANAVAFSITMPIASGGVIAPEAMRIERRMITSAADIVMREYDVASFIHAPKGLKFFRE
jgi:hypothetical protein